MSHRLVVAVRLMTALGLSLVQPSASVKEPTRAEEVARIEKRIAELQAQLVALKKPPDVVPSLPCGVDESAPHGARRVESAARISA